MEIQSLIKKTWTLIKHEHWWIQYMLDKKQFNNHTFTEYNSGVLFRKWFIYQQKPIMICHRLLKFNFVEDIVHLVLQPNQYIDGLVQERRNSSALAMELRLSCTNPSICTIDAHGLATQGARALASMAFMEVLWKYSCDISDHTTKGVNLEHKQHLSMDPVNSSAPEGWHCQNVCRYFTLKWAGLAISHCPTARGK